MWSRVVLVAVMLGAFGGSLAGCGQAHSIAAATPPPPVGVSQRLRGEPVLGAGALTDFALRDQDGALVRLSDQKGKVVLLTFLYTNCPDVCPLIAESVGSAVRSLGPDAEAVRVLAVSVDPEGDTSEFVRAFLNEHRAPPELLYLTGTRAELQPVWQAYNILAEERDFERINHSTYVLLIDATGTPRVFYPPQVTTAVLEHDLRVLLGS